MYSVHRTLYIVHGICPHMNLTVLELELSPLALVHSANPGSGTFVVMATSHVPPGTGSPLGPLVAMC